jgi:hypothetical protein
MGREGEGLAASPAKAGGDEGAVGGGDLFSVVSGGVEVGENLVGVEAGDGLRSCVHAGEGVGVAAVGASAGEQIRRDDDVAGGGEFVGNLLGPVGEAEDLMDEDDDRDLLADLGVDDEGLHRAVAVFDGYVLAVAWRGVEPGLCPFLGVDGERA